MKNDLSFRDLTIYIDLTAFSESQDVCEKMVDAWPKYTDEPADWEKFINILMDVEDDEFIFATYDSLKMKTFGSVYAQNQNKLERFAEAQYALIFADRDDTTTNQFLDKMQEKLCNAQQLVKIFFLDRAILVNETLLKFPRPMPLQIFAYDIKDIHTKIFAENANGIKNIEVSNHKLSFKGLMNILKPQLTSLGICPKDDKPGFSRNELKQLVYYIASNEHLHTFTLYHPCKVSKFKNRDYKLPVDDTLQFYLLYLIAALECNTSLTKIEIKNEKMPLMIPIMTITRQGIERKRAYDNSKYEYVERCRDEFIHAHQAEINKIVELLQKNYLLTTGPKYLVNNLSLFGKQKITNYKDTTIFTAENKYRSPI